MARCTSRSTATRSRSRRGPSFSRRPRRWGSRSRPCATTGTDALRRLPALRRRGLGQGGRMRVVTSCNYPVEGAGGPDTHAAGARRPTDEPRDAGEPLRADAGPEGAGSGAGRRGTAVGLGHGHLHPLRSLRARLRRDRGRPGARFFVARHRPLVTTPFDVDPSLHPLRGLRRALPDRAHPHGGGGRSEIVHSEISLGPNAAISLPSARPCPTCPASTPRLRPLPHGRLQGLRPGLPQGLHRLRGRGADRGSRGRHGRDRHRLPRPRSAPLKQYGYGRLPNVITSMEFERMNNAAGSTGGKIVIENGEEPRSIAILHCIGSRDENHHGTAAGSAACTP